MRCLICTFGHISGALILSVLEKTTYLVWRSWFVLMEPCTSCARCFSSTRFASTLESIIGFNYRCRFSSNDRTCYVVIDLDGPASCDLEVSKYLAMYWLNYNIYWRFKAIISKWATSAARRSYLRVTTTITQFCPLIYLSSFVAK